jgi:hypothetical protein
MTRHEHIVSDTPASREHDLRVMLERILAGDFSQVPLNLYSETYWTKTAQWFADVAGKPTDEAQVFAEVELMLRKSNWQRDYDRLPEREQERWNGFGNYADAREGDRFIPSLDAQIGVARKAMGVPRWTQLNREWKAA